MPPLSLSSLTLNLSWHICLAHQHTHRLADIMPTPVPLRLRPPPPITHTLPVRLGGGQVVSTWGDLQMGVDLRHEEAYRMVVALRKA